MKQTKFVASLLIYIFAFVLYLCAGFDLYAKFYVTKKSFGFILLATFLIMYRKEIIYLLFEREKKEDKDKKK
jgi:hypothetical protein